MKKIALLLALCMCLTCSLSSFSVFAQNLESIDVIYSDEELKEARILEKLGILTSTAEEFLTKTSITRGEIAALAVNLGGEADIVPSIESYFVDVDETHQWKNYIDKAVALGYMQGCGNYTFEPNESVTYTQLLKVIFNVMDCEWIAEVNGGYPAGYIANATKVGLASVRNIEKLDGPTVVGILYDALDAELFMPISYGEKVMYEADPDATLLSERHGIKMFEGVVTATGDGELYGESNIGENRIMIEETVMQWDEVDNNLLGMYVEAFYEYDRNNTYNIVFVEVSDKNDILTIPGGDATYENGGYTYFDDKNKSRRAKIDNGAAIIFNGTAIADPTFDMSKLSPEDGEVTLINNDGDNSYDVIKVRSYYNIKVSGVNTHDKVIYDGSEARRNLKLENIDKYHIYDKDGKEIPLEKLSSGTVVSVEEGAYSINIYVGNEPVNGTLSEIGEDVYIINGVEYYHTLQMKNSEDRKPKVGESGKFFIDAYGKIAFFELDTGKLNIGLMLEIDIFETSSTNIKAKLYDSLGEVKMYDLADSVKINGKKMKLSDKTSDGQNMVGAAIISGAEKENPAFTLDAEHAQVIRYSLNSEGKIKEIDTAVINAEYGEDDNTLHHILDYEQGKSQYFKIAGKGFSGSAIVDSNTYAYVVNLPLSDNIEDDISMSSGDYFQDNETYSIEALSFTKDKIVADVVVVYKDSSSAVYENSDREMVVDRVGKILSSNDDALDSVKGYHNGRYVTYAIKEGASLDGKLSQGDLIRFRQNNRGEITHIEHLYYAPNNVFNYSSEGGTSNGAGKDTMYRVLNGYIYHTYGDAAIVVPALSIGDVPESKTERYSTKNAVVYVYDKNDTRNKVYLGSTQDLMTYTKDGNQASRVIVRVQFADIKTILVIK